MSATLFSCQGLQQRLAYYRRRIVWFLRRPTIIVMLGAPGAGKGTVANELSASWQIKTVSMGDLFRKALASGSDIGKQLQSYVNTGKLAPDEFACTILLDELCKPEYDGGIILDGFPRTISQAKMLEQTLASWGVSLSQAIFIDVPVADLMDRLAYRQTCSNKECGRTFNTKMLPPKREGICDHCDSKLYQRADDKAEVVDARISTYLKETYPVVEFYSNQQPRQLLTVGAGNNTSKEETLQTILSELTPAQR